MLNRFLWAGAVLWLLLGTTLVLEMTKGSLFSLLIGFAPMGLLIWSLIDRAGKRETAHREMLQEAGVAPSNGFDHSEKGTSIAINKQAKTITLLIEGFRKTYPYTAIREWQAPGKDIDKPSFIVTVRDVDNPRWFILMKDKPTQERWMEILRQEINES